VKTTTSTATSTDTRTCLVCRAPEIELRGRCAFCGAEIEGVGDTEVSGLLDYLATRLPGVETGRGVLGRGPVRELRAKVGDEEYQARLRKDGLELLPSAEPAAWVDMLVASFTEAAASDRELRAALSRTGWAWR
jgi:hypothetical protein